MSCRISKTIYGYYLKLSQKPFMILHKTSTQDDGRIMRSWRSCLFLKVH